jgi:tight adherence protein B
MEQFAAALGGQIKSIITQIDHSITPLGFLAIALALVCAGVYVVLWFLTRSRGPDLATVLDPYRLTNDEDDDLGAPSSVLTFSLLTSAAARVEAPVNRTALGRRLEQLLTQAGSQIKVGELLTIWGIGGGIFALAGWFLAGIIGALVVLIIALVAPLAVLQGFADRRARLFANQLPDVLKLTASSLRAGFSLVQGLESVSRQVREPSRGQLQRVLAEARLGRPLEDALDAAAARIRNRDFTECVIAVRIQQESGGNLAGLFDTLADTMIQRIRMRREVRALTAEGRLTAYILGALPLALGAFIYVIDRTYVMVLFHSTGGKILFLGGLLLELAGFYWMYRTVKIEA